MYKRQSLCRANEAFAKLWRVRQRLPHDDYGTQARLINALQYTDDIFKVAVTLEVALELGVQFAHMIGVAHLWRGSRMQPASLARGVATHLASLSSAHSIPRPHGLQLPAAKPEKWWIGANGPWTGTVISAAYMAIWVPPAKVFRTLRQARHLLDGVMTITDYRSFVGFVSSLRDMRERGAYDMWASGSR